MERLEIRLRNKLASSQGECSFPSAMSSQGSADFSCFRRHFSQHKNTKSYVLSLLRPHLARSFAPTPADPTPSIAEQLIHQHHDRRQASVGLSAPPSTHGSPGHMASLTHRQARRSRVSEEQLRRRWA
ncbi:hypothetical protein BCR35DRAFT_115178 [Leucosporidium creatinivorum]|uniref:Uncharacterized protein n=1 Tax=Leucosporidium creatinivorum TaxID=106004 RepID=A0A1Y2F0G9_9BASI|nr:hypothetical protein BCR35DRAFT_115178 [Leucosporidium creatinivorum]